MKKKRFFQIFLLVISIFFFSACSFDAPRIITTEVKRLYIIDSNENLRERLSVFVLYTDKNGRNDYASMKIKENASDFIWTADRENSSFFLSSANNDTELWTGSNKFVYPGQRFPEGMYTITIEDLAGETAKIDCSLVKAPDILTAPFSFSLQDNLWKLTLKDEGSNFLTASLIFLGADRQPLAVQSLSLIQKGDNTGDIQEAKKLYSDSRYVQCLIENENRTIAFISPPQTLYP
ncbi:hypothetical protein [Treponema phagedenis]|uniref:hypothetical protein n=1 Tax=Treponema phagedenis TaxID=162 RepID=UPI0001F641A3|nr:hypothetical protein [Treponema phagedenis]EFW39467.1 hypothetical protein HMPREF9554_00024 [Treponema phagedenis F0421]TYT79642.1 hypothetical protein FS559_11475 [Treponema phagedenis]